MASAEPIRSGAVAAQVSAEAALGKLQAAAEADFTELFRHGSLVAELYAPREVDKQTPHTRDEVYVVMRGSGEFVAQGRRSRFGPGDFLFASAGVPHRFENFTPDFAVWVFFYGPEGGERKG